MTISGMCHVNVVLDHRPWTSWELSVNLFSRDLILAIDLYLIAQSLLTMSLSKSSERDKCALVMRLQFFVVSEIPSYLQCLPIECIQLLAQQANGMSQHITYLRRI